MPSPVLLGFDLATNTGWTAGDGEALPVVGHYRLRTGDVGPFLHEARSYYRILLDRFRPDAVYFECPLLGAVVTLAVTRKLHGLAGVLELECLDRGIDCCEVPAARAKKMLTGNGHAKKPEMVRAARDMGLTIETEDEADSAAVWLCGLHEQSPRLASRWDRLALTGLKLDLP